MYGQNQRGLHDRTRIRPRFRTGWSRNPSLVIESTGRHRKRLPADDRDLAPISIAATITTANCNAPGVAALCHHRQHGVRRLRNRYRGGLVDRECGQTPWTVQTMLFRRMSWISLVSANTVRHPARRKLHLIDLGGGIRTRTDTDSDGTSPPPPDIDFAEADDPDRHSSCIRHPRGSADKHADPTEGPPTFTPVLTSTPTVTPSPSAKGANPTQTPSPPTSTPTGHQPARRRLRLRRPQRRRSLRRSLPTMR